MSKVKYYYDSETLSYRKIEKKKGRKLKIFALSLLGIFLSGFLLLLVYINLPSVQTPKELSLQRELNNMQLQFKHINKKIEQAQAVLAEVEDRDNNLYRVYFESNPIPEEQRKAGFGGINRYKDLEGFDNSPAEAVLTGAAPPSCPRCGRRGSSAASPPSSSGRG